MALENIILKTKKGLMNGVLGLALLGNPYLLGCGSGDSNPGESGSNGTIYGNENPDEAEESEPVESTRDLGMCTLDDYFCEDFMENQFPDNDEWVVSDNVTETQIYVGGGGEYVSIENGDLKVTRAQDDTIVMVAKVKNGSEKTVENQDYVFEANLRIEGDMEVFFSLYTDDSPDDENNTVIRLQGNSGDYMAQTICWNNPTNQEYEDTFPIESGENELINIKIETLNMRETYRFSVNGQQVDYDCGDGLGDIGSLHIDIERRSYSDYSGQGTLYIENIIINPK